MISLLPCLQDNYAFMIVNQSTREAYCIDTPDGMVIKQWCQDQGLSLKAILNTHHHYDHIGGNALLKEYYNCAVYGAAKDALRIPGITHSIHPNETISLDVTYHCHAIPLDGHTIGLMGYYFPMLKALFVGDALFNGGCGRLFEGTAQQMYHSLERIKSFPDDTLIYCAHEYTLANFSFVKHFFPEIKGLDKYIEDQHSKRANHISTIPTLLREQKNYNPFLRTDDPYIKTITDTTDQENWLTFSVLRKWKDHY